MRGVGIVFARFLGTTIEQGVVVGAVVVFLYAVLGGMKGITYTQVAQYVVAHRRATSSPRSSCR